MTTKLALGLAAMMAPGLWTWFQGRRLLRLVDDPALPERLAAHWQRNVTFAYTSILIILLTFDDWTLPAILTAAFGVLIASFPLRRAVYDESWGIVAYVLTSVRLTIAHAGFWLLLLSAPRFASWGGDYWWIPATAVTAILLAWTHHYARVLLFISGSHAWEPGDLQTRIDGVNARSTASAPTLWVQPANGGKDVNAFALPSSHVPSTVVFTEPLLAGLTPAEIAAIYAHEVAHLEHHTPARLRRLQLIEDLAIVAGGLLLPASARFYPSTSGMLALWPFLIAGAFMLRQMHNQKHETESDRRAVELCGDTEAVASALLKLAAMSQSTRRWDVDDEQLVSHPSYARRIRDIRRAGGVDGPELKEPVVIGSTTPGRFAIFDSGRFHWLAEVATPTGTAAAELRAAAARVESLVYTQFADLRVQAGILGAPQLIARDHEGRTWSMPIAADDVARVRAALDHVDEVIRPNARPWFAEKTVTRGLSGFLAFMMLLSAQSPTIAVVLAVLACVRPSPIAFLAAGAAGLIEVMIQLDGSSAFRALLAALSALSLLLGAAWQTKAPDEAAGFRSPVLVVAAVLGLITWATIIWAADEWTTGRLHALFAAAPGAAACAAACGAALLAVRRRYVRILAFVCFALAGAATLLSASRPVARLVDDPAAPAVAGAPFRELRATLTDVRSVSFDGSARKVSLAPGGDAFVVEIEPGDDGSNDDAATLRTFLWFHGSEEPRPMLAFELRILDADHALALVRDGDGLSLRSVDYSAPATITELRQFPDLEEPELDLGTNGNWRVIDNDYFHDTVRAFEGGTTATNDAELHVKIPDTQSGYLSPVVSARAAIGVRSTWLGLPMLPFLSLLIGNYGNGSEVWTLAGEPRSRWSSLLELTCYAPPPGNHDRGFICASWDGSESGLFAIDPNTGTSTPKGRVPVELDYAIQVADGRMLTRTDWDELGIIDIAGGEIVRIRPDHGRSHTMDVAGTHLVTCKGGQCQVGRVATEER